MLRQHLWSLLLPSYFWVEILYCIVICLKHGNTNRWKKVLVFVINCDTWIINMCKHIFIYSKEAVYLRDLKFCTLILNGSDDHWTHGGATTKVLNLTHWRDHAIWNFNLQNIIYMECCTVVLQSAHFNFPNQTTKFRQDFLFL